MLNPENPAKEGEVSVHGIGWSRREMSNLMWGWLVFAAPLFIWVLMAFWGDLNGSASAIDGVFYGTFGAALLPIAAVYLAGRKSVRSEPFVTVTKSGLVARKSRLLPWARILRLQMSGDAAHRDLLVELKDAGQQSGGLDRFVVLYEGSHESRFRLSSPGAADITLSDTELENRLHSLRASNSAAALAGIEQPVPPSASQLRSGDEMQIPQTVSERVAAGLLGAIGVAASLGMLWMAWAIVRSTGVDGAIDLALPGFVVSIGLYLLFLSSRVVAFNASARPILIVNAAGVHHRWYGEIPWSEVTAIQVDDYDDGEDKVTVLCAYVHEPFYDARLSGKPLQRFELGRNNRNWKLQLTPRLPLIRGSDRREYSVNGRSMPHVVLTELARLVNEIRG